MVLGFAGVVIAARPTALFGGAGLDPFAVAVSVGAACASSVVYVTVRKLAQTEHPLVIVFYFPLVALPLTLPWVIPDLVMPAPIDSSSSHHASTAVSSGAVFWIVVASASGRCAIAM